MQIANPLQMNDWEIKKFLSVVLAIQLALWGVLGLEAIGLWLPFIRQVISLVYLLYVPGILILRILKLHKIGSIETLLYSVGLSVATLMFTGLIMNSVYPFLGISRPISTVPLSITLGVLVLLLSLIAYLQDRSFSDPDHIRIEGILSPPVLFLCLLPLLAVVGAFMVNFYDSNLILMILIVLIAGVILFGGFGKIIPKNLYPFAVFMMALSLLLHYTLISPYILGSDIHEEYQLANLVIINGLWNASLPAVYNSMLSVTMLAPIASIVSGMSLTLVFKIIYPVLFALAPLGLYRVFQKQTDDRIAFLSCVFLIALKDFYFEAANLPRQETATLFLVALILVMISSNVAKALKRFLLIVFGVSLIVSHYGLSYIFMYLVAGWSVLALGDGSSKGSLGERLYSMFSRRKTKGTAGNLAASSIKGGTFEPTFVLLLLVVALAWYMYSSGSVVFEVYVQMGNHIVRNVFEGILNPAAAGGLNILLAQSRGPLHQVFLILNYISLAFTGIGVFVLLFKYRELHFEKEYAAFAVLSLAIVFVATFLSSFSAIFSMYRFFYIVLPFLSPFCVIGGMTVLSTIRRIIKAPWANRVVAKWGIVLSVYFAVFFLFQTGIVWEVAGSDWWSIPLSQDSIRQYGDLKLKAWLYATVPAEQEVHSAEWLSRHMRAGEKVYATYNDIRVHTLTSYGMILIGDVPVLTRATQEIPENAYIYLQYPNVVEGVGTEFDSSLPYGRQVVIFDMARISGLFQEKDKIYSNGGSEIYQ